jgi:hypothetical protein
LDKSLKYVFGYNRFALFCAIVILTTWFFFENRLLRRFCLIFPLGTVIFFANPLVANLLATMLTGSSTYWRVFWLLPLPTIAALFFLVPLITAKFRWRQSTRYCIFYIGLAIFWIFLPQKSIFSENNYTQLTFPGLKVPSTYKVAKTLNDHFDGCRPNVLVPESVGAWLPTFQNHPYPLLSRQIFSKLYGTEGIRRLNLERYIAGVRRPEEVQELLKDALKSYQIHAVCYPIDNPWIIEILKVLNDETFIYQTESGFGYEIVYIYPQLL